MVAAVGDADYLFFCVGHAVYNAEIADIVATAKQASGLFDGANLFRAEQFAGRMQYCGIGRGTEQPSDELVDFTIESFRTMEQGVANELNALIEFLNTHYAQDGFNQVSLETVRELAGSCVTGCEIGYPRDIETVPSLNNFKLRLTDTAVQPA